MYDPSQQQGQGYTPADAQQELPLLLNRYRIVEQRGSGGFSSVLVCLDTTLGRRVAIKCMPLGSAATAGASTLNEALDEARITSQLNHPNIVTVHDFVVRDNIAYLIMEFVDGLTLSELIARVEGGVLTYDEGAHLLDCLASVLDYAHSNGVLHLDIKPSNVFIDTEGTIKLGDFGMASLASAAGWEGARGGTVGYMPPEQLQGLTVDERTDVFAMAVVLYQALTGISPFAAKDAEASLKKIQKGATPLAKVETELKGPVSDCIGRALNPEPGARQDSAGELARAILPYLGDELEGKASIAHLMAQVRGETGPSEEAWEDAEGASFVERHPHAPAVCARLVSGLACGMVAWRFLPAIIEAFGIAPASQEIAWGCFGALALFAAILPVPGGIAGAVICTVALFASGAYSPMFLVAVLAIAIFAGWGYLVLEAPRTKWAALLLPMAAASPYGGVAFAGLVLDPVRAMLTGFVGALLAFVLGQLGGTSGAVVAGNIAALFMHPGTWIVLAGCTLVPALIALFNRSKRAGLRILGQILGCVLLVCVQLVAARVENGGIWAAPGMYDVAVAVTLTVLMCIANAAQGQAMLREDV